MFHWQKLLIKETGLPVYVGNDANMMTIAEHRFGAAKGFNNIIFVALRTGIGGGIIINGNFTGESIMPVVRLVR